MKIAQKNPPAPRAKSPGRPPQPPEGSRDIRAALLDSAIVLFSSQSVAGTTVASIAAMTGVSPAMAHYYFKNRQQLIDAVVEERLIPLVDHVWSDFEPAKSRRDDFDLLAAIRGIVDKLLNAAKQAPWLPNLWITEILSESGALRQRVLPHVFSTHLQEFEPLFQNAQAAGRINSALIPRFAMGTIVGAVLLPLVLVKANGPNAEGLEQHVHAHVTAFLQSGLSPSLDAEISGNLAKKRRS